MTTPDVSHLLAAEQRARVLVDRQLTDAGWSVQDKSNLNFFAAVGAVVRMVIMAAAHARADYLLHVDKKAAGVRTQAGGIGA